MPPVSAPKFDHRSGKIWSAKIEHQVKTENLGAPDGNVCIAGKVTINLKSKEIGGDQQICGRCGEGCFVCDIDKGCQAVGNDNFFEQTPEDQL